MNQQAGPSIILSVLIVVFFGVALFPREPARIRGSAGDTPIEAPLPSSQRLVDPTKSIPPHSEPIAGLAPAPSVDAVKTSSPRRDDASRSVEVSSISSSPAHKPAVIRQTSNPSMAREPQARPIGAVTALPASPREAHQPSQAVTVVGVNETIADVALRVYGTTNRIDVLWRANRDALHGRDSPLVPGTLLRTPTVP
jgi:hypothetical protein